MEKVREIFESYIEVYKKVLELNTAMNSATDIGDIGLTSYIHVDNGWKLARAFDVPMSEIESGMNGDYYKFSTEIAGIRVTWLESGDF